MLYNIKNKVIRSGDQIKKMILDELKFRLNKKDISIEIIDIAYAKFLDKYGQSSNFIGCTELSVFRIVSTWIVNEIKNNSFIMIENEKVTNEIKSVVKQKKNKTENKIESDKE